MSVDRLDGASPRLYTYADCVRVHPDNHYPPKKNAIFTNMNIHFQLSRFVSYFKLLCQQNKLFSANPSSGPAGGILGFFFYKYYSEPATAQEDGLLGLCLIFMFVSMGGGLSFLENARTKHQRISVLMFPAGTLEKFLARYAYLTLALVATTSIVFISCDCIFYILRLLLADEPNPLVMGMLLEKLGHTSLSALAMMLSTFIYLSSFFLLCGLLFEKHPAIMSIVCMVTFVLAIVASGALVYGPEFLEDDTDMLAPLDDPVIDVVSNIIFVALIVFNYWASSRIFRRLQVVNPRLINW